MHQVSFNYTEGQIIFNKYNVHLLYKNIKLSTVCLQLIKNGHWPLHVQMTYAIIYLGFHGAVFKYGQERLHLFTISVVAPSRKKTKLEPNFLARTNLILCNTQRLCFVLLFLITFSPGSIIPSIHPSITDAI